MRISIRPGTWRPGQLALRAGGMTALTAALFVIPAAAPAQAFVPGPPCSGPTCVGKSPYISNQQGYTCVSGDPSENNGATTIASVYDGADGGETIYLRWSAYCQANWATISDPAGDPNDNAPDWYAQTADGVKQFPQGGQFTSMADGSQLARACEVPFGQSPNDPVCTGWN